MPYPPTVVSLPSYDYDFSPFDSLNADEKEAVEIIKDVLRSNGLPEEPLFFRYTDKYLTVGADKYFPFARLKLNKNLWYISLRIGDPETRKNFRRFELSSVSEISKYSSEIAEAYKTLADNLSELEKAPVSETRGSDISDFFSRAKSCGKHTAYEPTADESTFFTAYIEALSAVGLNWQAVPVEIMSDGAIKVRGGRVKLSKRGSYISYTKSPKELATKEKNLSLSEYIERQKYWISDCLENKELYSL